MFLVRVKECSRRAHVYDLSGFVTDLPDMNEYEERTSHACGSYLREDKLQVVSCKALLLLLVCAGVHGCWRRPWDGWSYGPLIESTKALIGVGVDASSWTFMPPLPSAAKGLNMVSLDNNIYITSNSKRPS